MWHSIQGVLVIDVLYVFWAIILKHVGKQVYYFDL